jgi:hypothetical protein
MEICIHCLPCLLIILRYSNLLKVTKCKHPHSFLICRLKYILTKTFLNQLSVYSECTSFCVCAGSGFTVAFAKVLTMCQLHDIWIHPFHFSPLSQPPLHSCNSFNTYNFCICMHVYQWKDRIHLDYSIHYFKNVANDKVADVAQW